MDNYGLAIMGKNKADIQEEIDAYYAGDVTIEKVEIEISKYF